MTKTILVQSIELNPEEEKARQKLVDRRELMLVKEGESGADELFAWRLGPLVRGGNHKSQECKLEYWDGN